MSNETTVSRADTGDIALTIWPMIALDPSSGVKQRAIAIHALDAGDDLTAVSELATEVFDRMDRELFVGFGNSLAPTGHTIGSTQMPFASKIILYTDVVLAPYQAVFDIFSKAHLLVEIIAESDMYKTLFISYGGTDQDTAATINAHLEASGITTWFFPDDALPGRKLHRVMHEEVNRHDRVLLICSRESLVRPGVLNEIERVLEREAKEGGTEILIPITLDDYVYEDWAPTRPDIAAQVRSRVITRIDISDPPTPVMDAQLNKLVKVLSRNAQG